MNDLKITNLTNALLVKSSTSKVLLFDPRDEYIDQAFRKSLSELEHKPIVIDFQLYDLNRREDLYYVYRDFHYYASNVINKLGNNALKRFFDNQYSQGLEWSRAGSTIPISNYIKTYMEEFYTIFNVSPWIILANIDVETEANHVTIGSLVFDAICSPFSENVIISCTLESWTRFEKGHDIFARIASRLRSNVNRLNREEMHE